MVILTVSVLPGVMGTFVPPTVDNVDQLDPPSVLAWIAVPVEGALKVTYAVEL